jgi:hypothetical protein
MQSEHHIAFGPFRLELETPHARLWRGEQALTLRARSLASCGIWSSIPVVW